MATVLRYCTKAQLGAAFRERYRDAKGEQALHLAWKLNGWIAEGFITDANLRNFFDMTQPQVDQLKTRIANKAQQYLNMQNAVGE
jgi:hypothetical protein